MYVSMFVMQSNVYYFTSFFFFSAFLSQTLEFYSVISVICMDGNDDGDSDSGHSGIVLCGSDIES